MEQVKSKRLDGVAQRDIQLAESYLQNQGWTILERDWIADSVVSIQLVGKDPYGTLCFVMVGPRDLRGEMIPSESEKRARKECFERVAAEYLKEGTVLAPSEYRFDMITIARFGNDRTFLRHLKGL